MDRFDWEHELRESGEPAMVKFAGLTLATYFPCIRPGISRLAADMSVSIATAKRHLAQLRSNGWIETAVPAAGAGRGQRGAGTAAVYRLTCKRGLTGELSLSGPPDKRELI